MMQSVNYHEVSEHREAWRSRGTASVTLPSFDFLLLRASRRVPLLTTRTCAASVARTTRRLALCLISLLACGCVAGGDSQSFPARIDRLDTIVEGLGTHVDTVHNQLDDKIAEQSGGGVTLLGWIAAALFYPVVWRTLRKRQEQNRLEHAGVSQEMMGLSALGVATCQKMAKERKAKPRRKLTRETMPHEPPRSLRKGKR